VAQCQLRETRLRTSVERSGAIERYHALHPNGQQIVTDVYLHESLAKGDGTTPIRIPPGIGRIDISRSTAVSTASGGCTSPTCRARFTDPEGRRSWKEFHQAVGKQAVSKLVRMIDVVFHQREIRNALAPQTAIASRRVGKCQLVFFGK